MIQINVQVVIFDPVDLNGSSRVGMGVKINVVIRVRVGGFLV